MKTLLLAGFLLIAVELAFTQPAGIKSIPGDYATIQLAIADLNSNGVGGGGVTFNVAANHTETMTSTTSGTLTATGTLADPIVFRRDPGTTGNNPKITAFLIVTSSATDGIIKIAGGDYVTFDGIDLQENPANISATKLTEWGYALVKKQNTSPFNGCQHVTIRNCTITLNKTNANSVGIYTGNHIATGTTALSITAKTDACNDCLFENNTISNVYTGISLNGFNASTPYSLYDHNNCVGQSGKNRIFNFGGSSSGAYGVFATYQDSVQVKNDSIAGGAGTMSIVAGIFLQTGTNSSAEISGNYISVTRSTTNGNNLYGIWNQTGGTHLLNAIKIHDNTIRNCTQPVTTTGNIYGIYNTGGADTVRIYNNEIVGSAYSGAASHFGIRSDASGTVQFIHNNVIHELTNSTTGGLTLIYTASFNTSDCFANNLHDCSGNGGTIYGLYTTTTSTWNVYRNTLNNISSNNSSAAACVVYGIFNQGAATANIYNNFVTGLNANAATNNPSITGVYVAGGTTSNVFYNTVYLDASSNGSTFGTAALYASTTPTIVLRNNILVNTSVPGTTGLTVAYRRSGTSLSNYSASSNNNCFYAGTPGPNNLIYYNGAAGDQTIAAYKARVSPRDALSFSENPPFEQVAVPPYNVHVSSSIPSYCESGATTVTVPDITSDIDNDPRFPNAGHPNHISYPGTAPDVGADEFGGIRNDLVPPVFNYFSLTNTSSQAARTLTVNITDEQSGVPVALPGLPVLYWKINDATVWNSAVGSPLGAGQYAFTFGGGVVLADVVYYYICAQDGFLTPNVAVSPATGADGLSANPPACSTPPASTNVYRIVGTLPAGNYLVGGTGNSPSVGCTYVDITQAFADVNNVLDRIQVTNGGSGYDLYSTSVILSGGGGTGVVASALIDETDGSVTEIVVTKNGDGFYKPPTVEITGTGTGASAIAYIGAGKEITGHVNFTLDTSYRWNEENAFPLHLEPVVGSGPETTITLRPGPLTSPAIVTYNGEAIFKLNGVDYFTLDGSRNGSSSRDLTLSLEYPGVYSAVVWIASASETDGATHNTVRNCILHGSYLNTYTYAAIFSGGTASIENTYYALAPNSFNTIENNCLYYARNGIVTLGKSTTELDMGLVIKNNQVGTGNGDEGVTTRGISVENQSAGFIQGNHVQNIIYNNHYHELTGIYINNSKNMDIACNEVNHISKMVSGSCYPLDGIFQRATAFNTESDPSNNRYYNNVVYDLTTIENCGNNNVTGIHNNGGRGDKYYYNSVYLTGQLSQVGLAACFSNGLAVSSGDAANIDVRNNIFFMNGYSPEGSFPDDSADYFAHYSTLGAYTGSTLDHNNLFVLVTGKSKGITGHLNSLDYSTLSAWKAATLQENNSISADPLFISATILAPQQGSPVLGAGTPIPGITTDFTGAPRNTLHPAIGAYENAMVAGKLWNGTVSSTWTDGSNWTPTGVPVLTDNLTIPAGTPFMCILSSTGLVCNNIVIAPGAGMTMTNASDLTVSGNMTILDGGTLANDGTLNLEGDLVNLNTAK